MNPVSKLFFVLFVTVWPYGIPATTGKPDLISKACDITLYKELCRSTLELDPQGRAATDLYGLATVALKRATSEGTEIRDQANKLLRETSDKATKEKLADCSGNFETAVEQLEESQPALASKAYADVKTWVSAAMTDAGLCEDISAIATRSTTFNQLCSNVLALTDLLADF